MRKLACPRRLVGAGSEHARSGLRSRSAPGPLARQRRGFAGFELRGRRIILARSGADFVAGAALSQCQLFSRFELHGRRSTFERSGADYVASAALSQGQVQISWQAQHFGKVKCRFCGRGGTFARSSADFVAGAALWQGQVQISWQVQHFRKVKYRFRALKRERER